MKDSYSIKELKSHFPKLMDIISGDVDDDFLAQVAEAYSALHYGSLVFSLAVMPALEKAYGKKRVSHLDSERMFFEVARAIEQGDIDAQILKRSIRATAERFSDFE